MVTLEPRFGNTLFNPGGIPPLPLVIGGLFLNGLPNPLKGLFNPPGTLLVTLGLNGFNLLNIFGFWPLTVLVPGLNFLFKTEPFP